MYSYPYNNSYINSSQKSSKETYERRYSFQTAHFTLKSEGNKKVFAKKIAPMTSAPEASR